METMDTCCTGKACAIDLLRKRQTATLRAVLLVNAAMFGVEFVSGLLAGSVALLADSLDMLGDALVSYTASACTSSPGMTSGRRGPQWRKRP